MLRVLDRHDHMVTVVARTSRKEVTRFKAAVVVNSSSEYGEVWVWQLADGNRITYWSTGQTGGAFALAMGMLPNDTLVVLTGDTHEDAVRVWKLEDGAPVGDPLPGHIGGVFAVAVGALPNGTPVVVSGSGDGTVRVWRLEGGAPVGKPLPGHIGSVTAVAVGALSNGTRVVVSGGDDRTVRVWGLEGGAVLVPALRLPAPVTSLAFHEDVVVAAAHTDIAVCQIVVDQPAFPYPGRG